jgi:hypothetical protein
MGSAKSYNNCFAILIRRLAEKNLIDEFNNLLHEKDACPNSGGLRSAQHNKV